MNQPLRKGYSMESTGYLGNSRVVLNHYDVSTQADIQHTALSYESEDENMGRFHSCSKRGTPLYSKQDIREQYCISDRGLGALETDRRSLFSCLSTHQNSPCSTRTSLLTVCVKQKIPSDENLQDLLRRYPFEYGYHRRPRYPWGVPPPEIYPQDEELECSYFRRKPRVDPRRYTWMPSDDESVRLERPRSVLDHCNVAPNIPPPPPPVSRPKHVSFARSHTLTSFDDAVVSLGNCSSYNNKMSRSQERLLPLLGFRKSGEYPPITCQPAPNENLFILEKFKRTPASMKTQATQTEACLGRKPLPPARLNLSPRTMYRVKMVSQGAQTNGILINGRKLMKSYSEAGGRFATIPRRSEPPAIEGMINHEPLQRTQSDEPPRSPFLLTSPPPELILPDSETSSASHSEHEKDEPESFQSKIQKEIIIDFEPQIPFTAVEVTKKRLLKTVSDGEILLDQRKTQSVDDGIVPDKKITSVSHENIQIEQESRNFTPYFQDSPIKNEGIFKNFNDNIFSSMSESFDEPGFRTQDSIDEEFHENLIYDGKYLRRSGSSTSDDLLDNETKIRKTNGISPEDESVVPSLLLLTAGKYSPFASNDSLANDARDHSDGIWNESQATVLQVDSGTDNGTALSSSEITSLTTPSAGSTLLLTPSSRRKYLLLLQHQQRSSMDTEALDEELSDHIQGQTPSSPRTNLDLPSISLSRPESTNQHYLTSRITPSPARHHRTPDAPTESPLPAVVPDLLLARTDSGKTNTDISESTTTTDDYITANSGTDSSRKNESARDIAEKQQAHTTQEGSSFESVSSIYGMGKPDLLGDDMVVPSFSPPTIPEEVSEIASTPVLVIRPGRSSPSGSSSSSGSYSLNGSCPDLPQKPSVPLSRHVPSISEDERSAHYSSSGYYESPVEDDQTWKSSRSEKPEWNEDEKKRRKKTFTLDISKHKELENTLTSREKQKTILKQNRKLEEIAGHSKEFLKATEKPKRPKVRTRSPLQTHRKNQQIKKLSPSSIRSVQHKLEQRDNTALPESKLLLTSDESSSGVCGDQMTSGQISPRKNKKFKENSRRKSIPRSPTSSRGRRRSDTAEDKFISSGSLPRRRSMQASILENNSKSRLSPYSASPAESPSKRRRSPKTSPESARLKALSAESLRSVSPGSDSVFYSDPSSHAALSEHQVHCLHCGKEVEIVTTDDLKKSSNDNSADIVQPPAGFADSPRVKARLYKKFEKRFRSEERSQGEEGNHRHRQDVRAKSEERGEKSNICKARLRPMARSTDNSLDGLRPTGSSPSVLPAAPEDEDDLGVYNVPYLEGYWIYIDDLEEMHTWIKPDLSEDEDGRRRSSTTSIENTESELEFKKKYQAVTHRMVHRKSCLEMYKRQASRSLESDKTVVVRRFSGEFGFRIHGSKPVVVSAIEPDTPAETSGLEIGDIVLSVNGISVLDKSHSEVVKIAHAGSDTLSLEVARTSWTLSPPAEVNTKNEPIYSSFLWKLSSSPANRWVRRWYALKKDNCLYTYENETDKQLIGAMTLINCDVCKVDNTSSGVPARAFRFDLKRTGTSTLHVAADTDEAAEKWVELLSHAIEHVQSANTWLEQARRDLVLSPISMQRIDCCGYLVKLGNQWKSWSRRYCVLKDACIYFYQEVNAKSAFGMACLHGYRVQQTAGATKKHGFEIIPSDSSHKHYYFFTESDTDRKRWVAALEYSIDRWIKVG